MERIAEVRKGENLLFSSISSDFQALARREAKQSKARGGNRVHRALDRSRFP